MANTNIEMLQIVAVGLGALKDVMVFVGGSVAELYADNPSGSEIRPTKDVDCVIELSSRIEHNKLEENLRAIGFANDTSLGAPICRWIYKDILVDVMPAEENILDFTNIWYVEGIKNKIPKTLPNGIEIFVFAPEYYVASKFEAHKGRGGEDLRQSHDFEDIVYIMDNYPKIVDDIINAEENVKSYLRNNYLCLKENNNLKEGIASALPYGSGVQSTDIIMERIHRIIKNEG